MAPAGIAGSSTRCSCSQSHASSDLAEVTAAFHKPFQFLDQRYQHMLCLIELKKLDNVVTISNTSVCAQVDHKKRAMWAGFTIWGSARLTCDQGVGQGSLACQLSQDHQACCSVVSTDVWTKPCHEVRK